MTLTAEPTNARADLLTRSPVASARGWVGAAGVASLGAGAIHATAIAVHAEHRPAALTFVVVATLQLGWGAVALVRSSRVVAVAGVVVNIGAAVGWVVAKTTGIPFIEGLDVTEAVQAADALAVVLAASSALVATAVVAGAVDRWARFPASTSGLRGAMTAASILVTVLTMWGMAAAGTHAHAGVDTAAGHGHESTGPGAGPSSAQAVAPVPYDPTRPIDLGGVDGVTPQQQAAAENLVAITLVRLPQWSDPSVAEAAGFSSIGDAFTGVEHFVNQSFMDDDVILDPDRPESLVYDTSAGGRRLVAAMYMTKPGLPLDQAPDIGGKLMQWHTHENLCYNAQGKVRGLTDAAGNCPPGLVKPVSTPMIHVWIEPHRCGPFAALEGIGGGRIPDGETVNCDHAHGSA